MCATPSSARAASADALPPGAVVGSSSLRRQAQVKRLRPDLQVIDFRGNVETRIAKIERGMADATLLALAGLNRLGLADHVTSILSTQEMLPAVAQGAIGIACRSDDARRGSCLQALNDPATATAVACERAFLGELDGSCRTPIAGLAEIADDASRFRGLVLDPEGTEWHEIERLGRPEDAASIGAEAGRELLALAGPNFLDKPHAAVLMRLLVTRPEPDATRQAEILAAHGHEPVVAPLLLIEPATDVILDLGGAQALIVTSRNALRALSSHPDLALSLRLPFFAVGEATAKAATDLGFAKVTAGPGTGEDWRA